MNTDVATCSLTLSTTYYNVPSLSSSCSTDQKWIRSSTEFVHMPSLKSAASYLAEVDRSQCTVRSTEVDVIGHLISGYLCPGPSPCTQIIASVVNGVVYITCEQTKIPWLQVDLESLFYQLLFFLFIILLASHKQRIHNSKANRVCTRRNIKQCTCNM